MLRHNPKLKIDTVHCTKRPCFPSPGISPEAQKYRVNIILPSTFWIKRLPYFPSAKSLNQKFSVISKHGIPDKTKYPLAIFARTERSSFSVIKILCKFYKYEGQFIFLSNFGVENDRILIFIIKVYVKLH